MISFKNILALSCLCAIASMFYVTKHMMATQSNLASAISSLPATVTQTKSADASQLQTSPEQQEAAVAVGEGEGGEAAATPTRPAAVKNKSVTIPDSALTRTTTKDTPSAVYETYQYSFEKLASNLHTRTNIARSQNKLSNISYDEALAKLATKRSVDMATHSYFSHTSLDGCDLTCRFKNASYVTLSFGENLAEYSDYQALSESDLAELFIDKWLTSRDHRKNLLSGDFTNEGIGVAVHEKRIVITVIFAKS